MLVSKQKAQLAGCAFLCLCIQYTKLKVVQMHSEPPIWLLLLVRIVDADGDDLEGMYRDRHLVSGN